MRLSALRSSGFLFLLVSVSACGNSPSSAKKEGGEGAPSAECSAYCEDVCALLRECPAADTTDCEQNCAKGLDAQACRGAEPADRLTCARAEALVQCSSYCEALCSFASDCATIDEGACRRGCLEDPPYVCNPRSVEPRGCDAIKDEAICYEESGDNDSTRCAQGGFGGFCTSSFDCDGGQACQADTNLCGACRMDSECERSELGAYVCDRGACREVDCVSDEQCAEDYCDLSTHKCVECLEASHCDSGKCDPVSHECTGCSGKDTFECGFDEVCDTVSHECVECLEDNDCFGDGVCNTQTHTCQECRSDLDCPERAFYPGVCDPASFTCIEGCLKDEHCISTFGPSVDSYCALPIRSCVECTKDEHCDETERCNGQRCIAK